jgi:hypothetical protein
MTKALRFSINSGLRKSVAGGLSQKNALVFKLLTTQSGDQLITQSGDLIGGNTKP